MYKSPIEITCEDYMKQYVEQLDNSVFMTIEKKFGANIDRVELIKALNYDREQYEKGFTDGVASAQPTWIPVTERLPEDGQDVLLAWGGYAYIGTFYEANKVRSQRWCVNDDMYSVDGFTHWMPFPNPPKGDE